MPSFSSSNTSHQLRVFCVSSLLFASTMSFYKISMLFYFPIKLHQISRTVKYSFFYRCRWKMCENKLFFAGSAKAWVPSVWGRIEGYDWELREGREAERGHRLQRVHSHDDQAGYFTQNDKSRQKVGHIFRMTTLNVALQARKQRWRGHRSQLQGVRQRQWRSDHEGGVDDHHEQPGRAPQWGGGDHHDRGGWLGWRWQDQFCRVSEIDGKQNCLDVSSLKLIFLDFQFPNMNKFSALLSSNSLDYFKKAKRVGSWNCQN